MKSGTQQDPTEGFCSSPPCLAWISPTQATEGYYWRHAADGRGEPSIVRVVLWQSGWLDGTDKPWRHAYLAECFGSMAMSLGLDDLANRGELLLKIEGPHVPVPNNNEDTQ
jgi:hypothetical protein